MKVGACDGAGRQGVLYSSNMGKICYDHEYEYLALWTDLMGLKMKVTRLEFNVKLPDFKLPLPSGVLCQEGPDLEAIMSDRGPNDAFDDEASPSEDSQPPLSQEDAMERAQEALKQMQEMLQGMEQQ